MLNMRLYYLGFLIWITCITTIFSSDNIYNNRIAFESMFLHVNNEDFTNYNQTTFERNQANPLLNTDDQKNIIYGNIKLTFRVQYQNIQLFFYFSRYAYWGNDNFQGRDLGNNPILVNNLYALYTPIKNFKLLLGRQPYRITDSLSYLMFYDIIDGIQINYNPFSNFKVHFMGDVLSVAISPSGVGIFSSIQKDDEQLENFRSDTISLRYGVNLSWSTTLPQPFTKIERITFVPFHYFVRYGANTRGGADLAENGNNAFNKADNDFLILSGLKIISNITPKNQLEINFAHSYGKDDQITQRKIYNGTSVYAHYHFTYIVKKILLNLTSTMGYFQPNFVSMKARTMGGLLLWGIKGYYPSAYTNFYHFQDYTKQNPQSALSDRTISKTFIKLKHSMQSNGYRLNLHGVSLFATQGFNYMGTELEAHISYTIQSFTINCVGAVYLPSGYHPSPLPINQQAKDPMYGIFIFSNFMINFGNQQKTNQETDNVLDQLLFNIE